LEQVRRTTRRVLKTIAMYKMIRRGDRLIVAVSGGPDSVCLLSILDEVRHELGVGLIVVHFDHGLRPKEDGAETLFVKSMARSLDLPFETASASPDIRQSGSSLEERARHARYAFLQETAKKFSAQKIAVGHNLNDQAETVMMRLLRGSGPAGLSGIPPLREEKIIRPLIDVSRVEIEGYLQDRGLKYMTDPTNLEPLYMRNRIRLELLPRLAQYQPRILEILGQTAQIMRDDEACLEEMAKAWIKEQDVTENNRERRFPLSPFKNLPDALRNRVIRCALKEVGGSLRRVSLRHMNAVKRLAAGERPQGLVKLPNRVIVRRVYDTLVFAVTEREETQGFCYFLDGTGTFEMESLGCTVTLDEMENAALPDLKSSPWIAYLDADRISYPLMIRNFRPGDRFIPLGMKGHKKLKDFFIDLKLSSKARSQAPILTQEKRIVWVCGLRIDDRFKITTDTRKVLKVGFKRQI
jgi:tRNA(Ile)-lysidine synthase